MKVAEYSMKDLRNNFRCNMKKMAVMFLILLAITIGISFCLSRMYSERKTDKDNTQIPSVYLQNRTVDERYFYNANFELKKMVDALSAYTQYLYQVNLNGTNHERLVKFQDELNSVQDIFGEVRTFYNENGPIYATDKNAAIKFVNNHINELEKNIESVEEQLAELGEYKFTSESDIAAMEKSLFEQHRIYENELKIWLKQEENLKEKSTEELAGINQQMEELLQEGTETYNVLAEQFNQMINNFEDEQYDIVYNPYMLNVYSSYAGLTGEFEEEDIMNVDKNSALIYARSVAGLDSRSERFFSYLTFGILFSIGISVLYGGFAKRSSRESSE